MPRVEHRPSKPTAPGHQFCTGACGHPAMAKRSPVRRQQRMRQTPAARPGAEVSNTRQGGGVHHHQGAAPSATTSCRHCANGRAWRWVSSEGRQCGGGKHGRAGGDGAVAWRQRSADVAAFDLLRAAAVDQAINALGVDFLRELAAVGFHQPHAQHVQVVDLPARALARGFPGGSPAGPGRPATISVRTSTSLSSVGWRSGLTTMLWS